MDLEKNNFEKAEKMIEIDKYLPKEKKDYFADVEKKHFNPETAVGSLFTEVKNLNDLLGLAASQRKSGLEGDDKTALVALGVPADALLPQCRYLLVKTLGEVGIINAQELPEKQIVFAQRLKKGVPCTLFVEVDEMPKTDIATIIIGPSEHPNATTSEMIWTVHPGLPIRPAKSDLWPVNLDEVLELELREVIKKLKETGEDEVYLNTKMKK